jgi:hypothetical protein
MRTPPQQPSIEETEAGLRKHVAEVTGDPEAYDRMVRAHSKKYPKTIVASETGAHVNSVRKWLKILERIQHEDQR